MDVNIKTDAQNSLRFATSIRGRLIIGFGFMIAIFIIAIVINLIQQNRTEKLTRQILRSNSRIETIFSLTNQIRTGSASLNTFLLGNDKEQLNENKRTWNNIHELKQVVDSYAAQWSNNEDINNWREVNRCAPWRGEAEGA